jgi:isopropylmalate/homocitrate/citramalate synthase
VQVHTSPYNAKPLEQLQSSFPAKVLIQDITLREGQQAAEVAFSIDEKVELATKLVGAGITRIQAGYAGDDNPTIRALKQRVHGTEVTALLVGFRDGWEHAAESAAESGVDILMVLFRSGARQLQSMGVTEDQALKRVDSAVRKAISVAPTVSFHPSFVTLSDEDFLRQLYKAAAEAGATDFGVADSTGVASPEGISYIVRLVREVTNGGTVGVHCHDDFGLALANTLAGIRAGATVADASLLGLGERAGNCATEELVISLELLYHVDTGVHLDKLTSLDQYVGQVTGVTIPPMKAVAGANVFSQKLDMHVSLTQRDPTLLEPYPPETVGNTRAIRLGVGTGPVAIKERARQLGLMPIDDETARELAKWANELALQRKSYVTDEEFRQKAETGA